MKILKSIYINPEQRRPKQQCCIYYLSKHEDTDIEYVNKDRLAIAEAALETAKLALDSIKSELQRCEADDSGMYHAADKALKAITEANHA